MTGRRAEDSRTHRWLVGVGIVLSVLVACQLPDARQSIPLAETATAAARLTASPATLTPIPAEVTIVGRTPPSSATPVPSTTPAGPPTPSPPFRLEADGSPRLYATPPRPPVTPIPPAAEPIYAPQHITTVLLLGSDQRAGRRGNATDTIILVAINREAEAVNMLSIPRDTYVYIPGWTMDRVNTALIRGEVIGFPGGGMAMLRETLLYNFGVSVDYVARVDIEGFRQIIDAMGGIDVPVDCELTDWRLISPELDINLEENWERFTLGVGVHHMDGDLALWYARSRLSTTDFDRNRRQQQILRALWAKSHSLDLVTNLPALWDQMDEVVETDMPLAEGVALAPVALEMEPSRVRGRSLSEALSGWRTPDTGAAVQLPDLQKTARIFEWLYVEPAVYAVAQEASRIEVLNGTINEGWDVIAADRLAREGLAAFAGGQTESRDQERTQIIDYTGQAKGTSAAVLANVLRVPQEDIVVQPDPERKADFRVILGYDYRSCTYR